MKKSLFLSLFALISLVACSTSAPFKVTDDMSKFYSDKLSCENLYTQGFNIWGNKVYGDINSVSAARDCMMAKGYQIEGK